MNTELRRLFFGAIEDSAFHYGTRFRVSPADIASCRTASSADSGTPVLRLQPVQATNSGAAS
jgi:hypothetical protein